jgi:hypothetical protein
MGREIQVELARYAVQQNAIIHEYQGSRGGIVVCPGSCSYALRGKLNRLCEENSRLDDITNAVSYLHQYLQTFGREPANTQEIYQWGRQYRKKVTDAVLDQVDGRYYQTYGRHAIVRQ